MAGKFYTNQGDGRFSDNTASTNQKASKLGVGFAFSNVSKKLCYVMKIFPSYATKVAFIFCLAVSLSGCSQQVDKVVLLPESVIVAYGDSLTFGTGVSPQDSYPSVLQQELGITVINQGVPGETSSSGLKRLEGVLKTYRPHLVILCHGGNDILRGLSEAALTQNLEQMIELVHSYNAEVLLVGVPNPSIFLSALPLYEELATKHQLPLDSESLPDLLGSPAMKSDRVHLNEAGYRALALALSEKIEVF